MILNLGLFLFWGVRELTDSNERRRVYGDYLVSVERCYRNFCVELAEKLSFGEVVPIDVVNVAESSVYSTFKEIVFVFNTVDCQCDLSLAAVFQEYFDFASTFCKHIRDIICGLHCFLLVWFPSSVYRFQSCTDPLSSQRISGRFRVSFPQKAEFAEKLSH